MSYLGEMNKMDQIQIEKGFLISAANLAMQMTLLNTPFPVVCTLPLLPPYPDLFS